MDRYAVSVEDGSESGRAAGKTRKQVDCASFAYYKGRQRIVGAMIMVQP